MTRKYGEYDSPGRQDLYSIIIRPNNIENTSALTDRQDSFLFLFVEMLDRVCLTGNSQMTRS
jgi:hypothetical protein